MLLQECVDDHVHHTQVAFQAGPNSRPVYALEGSSKMAYFYTVLKAETCLKLLLRAAPLNGDTLH